MKPETWNITGLRMQAILLALCVGSRMLTSLHYVADPDSLRFALAATDFDLVRLQPHFPGYPVFCFLLQAFTALTGKFSLAFSLIGGLSTFVIIHYLLKLVSWAGWNIDPWLLAGAVFFNPMIWIMGNRYMPDLMGLALAVAACSFFVRFRDNHRTAFAFMFIAGLLAGTRLSFIPLLLLPALWIIVKGKQPLKQLVAGAAGVLVWLVPMIVDTGWSELLTVAATHTEGHFSDWGGTIGTESSFYTRVLVFAQSIIADGLGCYWPGRNMITALASILLITGIIAAVLKRRKNSFADVRIKVLLLSVIVYALWVFLFQNIIYNPRHIMPLVPVLLLVVVAGYTSIARNKLLLIPGIALIATGMIITLTLVKQQMQPTAIAVVSEKIRKSCDTGTVIVSTELINYFLEGTGVKCDKVNIASTKDLSIDAVRNYDQVITVGNFELEGLGTPKNIRTFYHNPYVNRIWAEISVREYVKER